MFAEIVARYIPDIVAAVVLLPVTVVALAMLLEGVRKPRWTSARKAGAAQAAHPRPIPKRDRPVLNGGAGLRHGIAAPCEHD